jgi:NADPH:quinone reductase-like Zn-dependent oxidoreductase
MRAVVHDRYGPPDVLRLDDVERPVPASDEVLVRIHATTVNRTDTGFRSAEFLIARFYTGLLRPRRKILGSEFAGEVEAVGAAVTDFAVGDRVFGLNAKGGAHAEFISMPESAPLAPMPTGVTFEEAAAVCDGALLALWVLRRANVGTGQKVIVYGASGSIGTAAVQLAKHFDAAVTAVCSTENVELMRSLGANAVIDYTQQDFTKNGETYDLVFDAVGKLSFGRSRRSLKTGGVYAVTDLGSFWQNPFFALWTSRIGDKRVLIPLPRHTKKDVLFLKELMEAGQYRAVIDRSYPLEDVAAAASYVETGQKTGNVVLTVT